MTEVSILTYPGNILAPYRKLWHTNTPLFPFANLTAVTYYQPLQPMQ